MEIKKIMEDVIIDPDVIFKCSPNIIGNHIAIDKGFYCTTQITIGGYVHIGPYITCIGGKNGNFTLKGFNKIIVPNKINAITNELKIFKYIFITVVKVFDLYKT